MDALIEGLKSCDEVADRLKYVNWGMAAMLANYPGDSSRYIKHVDNLNGTNARRLTMILYLNRAWMPDDGGRLPIFDPSLGDFNVKYEVDPIWNRLLLFWSTDEVPHEVLPAYKDRVPASVWYLCGRESLGSSRTFQQLFETSQLSCVAGKDPLQCLEHAARTRQEREAMCSLQGDYPFTQ